MSQKKSLEKRMLTVEQYAAYLEMSAGHIYNCIYSKKTENLPTAPIRIGTGSKATIRFDKVALDKWINEQQSK